MSNNTLDKHILKQKIKAKSKEKALDRNNILNSIVINDAEIIIILKAVKLKKYNVMENINKLKKLQKMKLLKAPNAIQTASSFSFPFYLTPKGEKLITNI